MTADSSTRAAVSAKGSGEAAVSSENAVIEKVAKLAKQYAAGTPSDEDFKALKARLISQASNWEKPASFRHENLASPGSVASSRDEWFDLETQVRGRVGPATKVRRRAKQHIPVVLTLALFMGLAGPIYLDDAYAPLLPDKVYRTVGAGKTLVPTDTNGEPGASSGNGRGAYGPGCETRWNVIPPTDYCVRDSLWDEPQELSNGYRFFAPTASSTLPDQSLPSWARTLDSKIGDALQIRGRTIRKTDREVTAGAPDRPKLSSSSTSRREKPSLRAAPSPSASEHSTVVQQHKASMRLRVEHLQPQAKLTPVPQGRPKTIDDEQRARTRGMITSTN
jgi:hypothetical protein